MTTQPPREHVIEANGLRHHVVEWGETGDTVVLLHGFLDLAFAFDVLARRLVARGYHVFAADARGHGETDWVGRGGYYHFPDYTLDLDAWTRALGLERFHLVGHSMGGTVATMFAGARPGRVRTLVSIEGLGPPEQPREVAPARFGRWFDAVERTRTREAKPMASVEEALSRMRMMNPRLPDELGLVLATRATKPHASGIGLVWRHDPLHRTESPVPYSLALHRTFFAAITAPTLVLLGERGMRLADEATRIAGIPGARSVEIPDVGHMIHWEAPDVLAELVAAHFEADCGPTPSDAELAP